MPDYITRKKAAVVPFHVQKNGHVPRNEFTADPTRKNCYARICLAPKGQTAAQIPQLCPL